MIMMGDRKKQVAAILGPKESEKEKDSGGDALHAISQELIDALHAKDAPGVAEALRAAFTECDSQPHVEGPHVESEDED